MGTSRVIETLALSNKQFERTGKLDHGLLLDNRDEGPKRKTCKILLSAVQTSVKEFFYVTCYPGLQRVIGSKNT